MNRNLTKLMKVMSQMRDIESEDILARVGLTRRRTLFERVVGAIGLVSAGIIVGAGIGILVSPVAPAEARKKLGEGMRSVKNEFNELVSHETSKLTSREPRTETPKNGLVAS